MSGDSSLMTGMSARTWPRGGFLGNKVLSEHRSNNGHLMLEGLPGPAFALLMGRSSNGSACLHRLLNRFIRSGKFWGTITQHAFRACIRECNSYEYWEKRQFDIYVWLLTPRFLSKGGTTQPRDCLWELLCAFEHSGHV